MLFHAYRYCTFSGKAVLEHPLWDCSGGPQYGTEGSISSHIARDRGVLHSNKSLRDSVKEFCKLPSGFHSFYTGEVPTPQQVNIANYRQTSPSRRKDWERAKRSGKILIRPMLAYECNAVLVPGAVVPDSGTSRQTITQTGYYSGEFKTGIIPCRTNAVKHNDYTHFEGLSLESLPYMSLSASPRYPFSNVEAHYDSYEVESLSLPSAADAYKAWSGILSEIQKIPIDQGLVTSAVAEANSGIYDLLTELGEIRDTMSFIFGIFSDILRLSKQVKKDVLRARKRPSATAASIADEISAIWMKYRYAVSPLVYSANDLLDLRTGLFGKFQTFRSGTSHNRVVEIEGWDPIPVEVIDRMWCKYKFDVLDGKHGLKLNLLSTAWELTPLSFVVDWVLNVGDLLSALVLPSNVQETAYQYSRQMRDTEFTLKNSRTTQTIRLQCRYYRANPIQPIQHLGLDVNLSMTWKRWIDALALSWFTAKRAYKR